MRIRSAKAMLVASAALLAVAACDVNTEPKSTVTETNPGY